MSATCIQSNKKMSVDTPGAENSGLMEWPWSKSLLVKDQWSSLLAGCLHGALDEKSFIAYGHTLQTQQHPEDSFQAGNLKTLFIIAQSPLTSHKKALHPIGVPAVTALFRSSLSHGVPSCLCLGCTPEPKHVKDHDTTRRMSSIVDRETQYFLFMTVIGILIL